MGSYSSDQAVTGSTGVIGHYTQVVWAETAEVGCGYMTSFVNDRLESVRIFASKFILLKTFQNNRCDLVDRQLICNSIFQ